MTDQNLLSLKVQNVKIKSEDEILENQTVIEKQMKRTERVNSRTKLHEEPRIFCSECPTYGFVGMEMLRRHWNSHNDGNNQFEVCQTCLTSYPASEAHTEHFSSQNLSQFSTLRVAYSAKASELVAASYRTKSQFHGQSFQEPSINSCSTSKKITLIQPPQLKLLVQKTKISKKSDPISNSTLEAVKAKEKLLSKSCTKSGVFSNSTIENGNHQQKSQAKLRTKFTSTSNATIETQEPLQTRQSARSSQQLALSPPQSETLPISCSKFPEIKFVDKKAIKVHSRRHKTTPKFRTCNLCSVRYAFNSATSHRRQCRARTPPKKINCQFCTKSYYSKSTLKVHIRSHTGERPFSCSFCAKTFKSRGDLHSHIQTHTKEKRYKCQFCQQQFGVHARLKIHIRIHTGERPFKCSLCPATFKATNARNQHLRTHSENKPFQCTMCDKKFRFRGSLASHNLSHSTERLFDCKLCTKEFKSKPGLERHIITHTKELHFECTFCSKRFATITALGVHMRIHTGEKPYKCSLCWKSFTQSTTLKKHLKYHQYLVDRGELKCTICGKVYLREKPLNDHMQTHIASGTEHEQGSETNTKGSSAQQGIGKLVQEINSRKVLTTKSILDPAVDLKTGTEDKAAVSVQKSSTSRIGRQLKLPVKLDL